MSLRPILIWPDVRLSTVCAPIDAITPEIRTLAADMLETMYAAPGRGLAAPQVGVLQRIFVMDVAWKDGAPEPVVCINPAVVAQGDVHETNAEGCLSIPGVSADVSRPGEVRMTWTDIDGMRHDETLTGFAAICAQHELDHLDGVVTLDRVDVAQRDEILAQVKALI
ncbi:peptide deformylase [uncultured Tateyamaria sp.]|uniref:peptide deformylase n=1 Tax=uncultured Tateyamaria sp. TaxID=455651 RepID=UPI0026180FEE|nr:peptide deformylase [uncultured Tateyamaria sp.]